jgi:cytochrome c-type biogenesis protein
MNRTFSITPRWQITLHAAAFLLGVGAVFISLGALGGFVGALLVGFGELLRIGAGILLLFFGLLMLRLIPLPFLQRDLRAHLSHKPTGYAGSVLVGLAFGAGWTPCIGPILASIITVASARGSATQGAMLLTIYALGFAIPFVLAAQMLPAIGKLSRYTGIIEKMSGGLLLLVGLVLLTGVLGRFSPYLASLGSFESLLGGSVLVLPGDSVPFSLYPLALLAGALSFMSPCVLPILPSFLAYLTGVNAEGLRR